MAGFRCGPVGRAPRDPPPRRLEPRARQFVALGRRHTLRVRRRLGHGDQRDRDARHGPVLPRAVPSSGRLRAPRLAVGHRRPGPGALRVLRRDGIARPRAHGFGRHPRPHHGRAREARGARRVQHGPLPAERLLLRELRADLAGGRLVLRRRRGLRGAVPEALGEPQKLGGRVRGRHARPGAGVRARPRGLPGGRPRRRRGAPARGAAQLRDGRVPHHAGGGAVRRAGVRAALGDVPLGPPRARPLPAPAAVQAAGQHADPHARAAEGPGRHALRTPCPERSARDVARAACGGPRRHPLPALTPSSATNRQTRLRSGLGVLQACRAIAEVSAVVAARACSGWRRVVR
mmetsp:Transcript_80934/g.247319  ORF Transcript_80934/g.247319 Transcript_80934/m.247319 type:complete len:347 (+) Transcript_80934:495-1535(+)